MNIFEKATRNKIRFPSARGDLTVEQLWDLPLVAKPTSVHARDSVDLDTVARTVNKSLKEVTEESFVNTKPHPDRSKFELQLEVVKHVIGVKQAEEAAAKVKADKAAERELLVEALARKQTDSVNNMSEEEIRARLAALAE